MNYSREELEGMSFKVRDDYSPERVFWIEKEIDYFLNNRKNKDFLRHLDKKDQRTACTIAAKDAFVDHEPCIDAFNVLGIKAKLRLERLVDGHAHSCTILPRDSGYFLLLGAYNNIVVGKNERVEKAVSNNVVSLITYGNTRVKNMDVSEIVDKVNSMVSEAMDNGLRDHITKNNSQDQLVNIGYFVVWDGEKPAEETSKELGISFLTFEDVLNDSKEHNISFKRQIDRCPFNGCSCEHMKEKFYVVKLHDLIVQAYKKLGLKSGEIPVFENLIREHLRKK